MGGRNIGNTKYTDETTLIQLKGLLRHAVRIHFGYQDSITDVMQSRGIKTPEERSIARVNSFIRKTINHRRFLGWYEIRPEVVSVLGDRRQLVSGAVKMKRMFNNPRSYFIRKANELGLTKGQEETLAPHSIFTAGTAVPYVLYPDMIAAPLFTTNCLILTHPSSILPKCRRILLLFFLCQLFLNIFIGLYFSVSCNVLF